MISELRRNIKLLFHSPKDFIYSVKYSGKRSVKTYRFDPKIYLFAKKLMVKIRKEIPGLDLFLIGSTGLKIEGQKDIDLYATTLSNDIPAFTGKISKLFCEPSKRGSKFVQWYFEYDVNEVSHAHKITGCPGLGIMVSLVLTHPQNNVFKEQMRLFNLLKNNPVYLNEYRKLKRNLNGHSEKEYVRKRMEFFNHILSS